MKLQNKFLAKNHSRLGAVYNPAAKSIDFKLYSLNATHVILCIFKEAEGEESVFNVDMLKNSEDIFEVSVKLSECKYLKKTFYYGFRVFGPNWEYDKNFKPNTDIGFKSFVDENHNRFNPNKIAYDPYGLEISHLPSKYKKFRVNAENYKEDNSKYASKSTFNYIDDFKMSKVLNLRAPKDEIIGEVHLKDLTELLNIKEHGTYTGALKFAKRLKEMGFTTIEFLPLNEFDDENNHWGYIPLSYFAISKKYSYSKKNGEALNEFRKMVNAFHENDIKVCMDIVFNHTGEARTYSTPNDADLMSYALIDNQTYYKQTSDNFYTCYSGCNNDFNVANKGVQDLIIDSLEFWIKQGVDAFRFDLAAALMDKDSGMGVSYDKYDGFICHIEDRLKERGIRVLDSHEKGEGVFLIAEPWVCSGSCCYQLGNFPSNWLEWSDVARNTIRANTISPQGTDPLGLRNLIEGTPFCFGEDLKAINYIASHDGFTLNDLNSYDKKSAETSDGSDWEMCSSYGGDKEKQELSIKKQVALLFLSKGIPMLQVGDMVGHTKLGNNNSYNLDNYINYIDFSKIKDKNSREYRIYTFIKSMMNFRKSHKILSEPGYHNKIDYYGTNANIIPNDNWNYWQNKGMDYFLFKINDENAIYCATSKARYPVEIKLPKNKENKNWYQLLDTTKDGAINNEGELFTSDILKLEPNSFMMFIER